jgi:2-polyprenyl-3-methyl-5-hydroxy-6-metoxy-1,4-benzoquinol methylase
MKCRHCASELELSLVDLGSAPPSNAYLTELALKAPEKWFPLRVLVCQRCWLVQTEDFAEANELFDADYAYFSGFSSSWLAHCERYAIDMIATLGLDVGSHVVEVATNDGSLLRNFAARGIACTGIEPTASTAAAAKAHGIDVVEEFFGTRLARALCGHGRQADLMTANNVLAHVPDINDFVAGFTLLLKPDGVATFEFPHLVNLVAENQFDTIYHEHYSYLSFTAANTILGAAGLEVFDVQALPTHGGSLRVFAQRSDTGRRPHGARVQDMLRSEAEAGVTTAEYYAGFQAKAEKVKDDLIGFLIDAKRQGLKVAAYGAAAKGNTLLNFAGVRPDLVPYVVDRNPAKQRKYLPGSRIPVVAEDALSVERPDLILILPWNLKDEIKQQLSWVATWGGRFLTAIPALEAEPYAHH